MRAIILNWIVKNAKEKIHRKVLDLKEKIHFLNKILNISTVPMSKEKSVGLQLKVAILKFTVNVHIFHL